ncbi:RNA-directed DNA polymerase, eukaryota [Tanacetum coccineum]
MDLDKQSSVATKLRDSSLISSFKRPPRGGIEEEQIKMLVESISSIVLPQIGDRWIWRLDSLGYFSVKSACCFIDDSLLPKAGVPTRWVNATPIKINIFAWRVCFNKLPTRLNLSLRGIDIPSIICPLCSIAIESTSHLLFSFHLARQFAMLCGGSPGGLAIRFCLGIIIFTWISFLMRLFVCLILGVLIGATLNSIDVLG